MKLIIIVFAFYIFHYVATLNVSATWFFPCFVPLHSTAKKTCSSSYNIICTYTTRDRGESTLQQPLLRCCRPSQKKGEENASRYQQKWRPGGLVYRRQEFDRSLSQVLDLVGSGSNKRVGARVHLLFFVFLPFGNYTGLFSFCRTNRNWINSRKKVIITIITEFSWHSVCVCVCACPLKPRERKREPIFGIICSVSNLCFALLLARPPVSLVLLCSQKEDQTNRVVAWSWPFHLTQVQSCRMKILAFFIITSLS